MPIPKPKKGEKQDDFIGRCIPLVLEREDLDKDSEDDRKQATAICFNTWREAKEAKAMEMKAEEQSLEEQLLAMQQAFDRAFNREELAQPTTSYTWIEKTLDDHIIAKHEGKFYKVPFSTDAEGEITFGEPEEVEKIERYVAVKAIEEDGDWIIEAWGAPPGGPDDMDADEEWFTLKTDFGWDMLPTRFATFHHGLTEDDPQSIGEELSVEMRAKGPWVRILLDKTKELAKKAWDLALKNALFISSGAISHLTRKLPSGEIIKWPIAEWAMTPSPKNKHAVAFAAAKALFEEGGIELTEYFNIKSIPLPDLKETEAKAGVELADTHGPEAHQGGGGEAPSGDAAAKAEAGETPTVNRQTSTEQEATTMEDIRVQLEAILAEREAEAKAEAEAEELTVLRDEVKAQKTRLDEMEAGKERKIKHPTASGIEVKGTVWDQMDPEDRELVGMLMAKQGRALSEDLMRAIKGGLEENMPKYKVFLDEAEIKAIALMDKTDTANWVPANYEARIWDKLRVENRVASLFRQINMPTDNYYLPVATAGPTVYVVPEQTAGTPTLATGITTSQVTDAKVTLASSKIGSAVWFSGEMDEDGVLPMLPIVRDQIGKAIDEAVEYVLLNGDQTTGGTNITDTSAGTTSLCVAQDGLRHFGLVDATTYKADLGTLTAADFITLRSKMGIYGLNPEDIAYLCDYNSIYKAWDIDEVATLDKFGPSAVILKGQTAAVYGSPLIASGQMNKFGTDGKYHATPTTGIIIAVHRPSWIIGWRRRIKFGVNYFDNVDATRVTSLLRMAFEPFGTSLGHACVGYNVTVV